MTNQHLLINGMFKATDPHDALAAAIERRGAQALGAMPPELSRLPRSAIALREQNIVGLNALQSLLSWAPGSLPTTEMKRPSLPAGLMSLRRLIDELATAENGLVMVMGKDGVGKTTIAAAVAASLAHQTSCAPRRKPSTECHCMKRCRLIPLLRWRRITA